MNPSDPLSILKEVRRLEISTRGAVDTLLKGSYKSTFRGQGLEFHQVREYVPEDDVRSIDWNVTARLNAPYVKTFVEERELQIILAVDLSASLWTGTGRESKRETLLKLCAVLAFAAVGHQDRVGLMVFTDRVEYFLPPKKGKAATLGLLRQLLSFKPSGRRTDFLPAFRALNRSLRRRSVLVLLSDFTDPLPVHEAGALARRHDLVAAVVRDPLESGLELPVRLAVRDPETGKVGYLGRGTSAALRKAEAFREAQLRALTAQGADRLDLTAGASVVAPLVRFFRKRIERMGRR
jgi:uncharacterized protein (DUF58 family)